MTRRALSSARAFCSLRLIARASGTYSHGYWIEAFMPTETGSDNSALAAQFRNISRITHEWPELVHTEAPHHIQWALHVIPSLNPRPTMWNPRPRPGIEDQVTHFLDHLRVQEEDISSLDLFGFTNYLCCVNSFFGPINPQIMAQLDKREFQFILLLQLFKALQNAPDVTPAVIGKIVNITAEFSNALVERKEIYSSNKFRLMREISRFCGAFSPAQGWLDVLVSAATLARVETLGDLKSVQLSSRYSDEDRGQDVRWIYAALEHVHRLWQENRSDTQDPDTWDRNTTRSVESLLHMLACAGDAHRALPVPDKPPSEYLHLILRALSSPGDISFAAFLVLTRAQLWFRSSILRPIMQKSSVWSHLGSIALRYPNVAGFHYIEMGYNLSRSEEWKSVIYEELPTWIAVFASEGWGRAISDAPTAVETFIIVTHNIWGRPDEHHQVSNKTEASWAAALTALSNIWEKIPLDVAPIRLNGLVELTRCTISTSLEVDHFLPTHWDILRPDNDRKPIPPDLRATFCPRLGKSIAQAASKIRNTISEEGLQNRGPSGFPIADDQNRALERVVDVLATLGQKIGSEFEPAIGELTLGGSKKRYENWRELKNHFQTELDDLEAVTIVSPTSK
ncbi:hypothetical protein DFH09DRAFT_1125604 [Mycena vulgaris]|nr:hypothetical protein DFH09DRAFT_1125604 [Mycena vulgaris]